MSTQESTRSSSRAALLEAALAEFSDKGFEATTVAEIAERAGVTTGALYAHFKGKLDLLLETIGLGSVDDLRSAAAAATAAPWDETATTFLGGSFAGGRVDQRTVLIIDLIAAARRDPKVAAILRRGLDAYADTVVQMTTSAAEAGVVDPVMSPDDLGTLFVTIALGVIVRVALDDAPPSDQAFVQLANLLLQTDHAPTQSTEPPELARVRSRASASDAARDELHRTIIEAVEAGHSLRAVGAAAGISHERVRQLLNQDHRQRI